MEKAFREEAEKFAQEWGTRCYDKDVEAEELADLLAIACNYIIKLSGDSKGLDNECEELSKRVFLAKEHFLSGMSNPEACSWAMIAYLGGLGVEEYQ